MGLYNQTMFILVGFTVRPEVEICIFSVMLIIYLLSLFGNLAIVAAILVEKCLQTPMYFFLSSLAFADIGFISCTVPTLLYILATENGAISKTDCIMQLYFYVSFGSAEFILLGIMSVDRYVAISHPLRYSSIITSKMCAWLILLSWVIGFFAFIYPIKLLFNLSFCGPFKINHFFCESSVFLKISCSDTNFFYMVFTFFAGAIILVSFMITFVSYVYIISAIMKISSSSGKKKAFSTCTSHFTAVSMLYGCVIFLYIRPAESVSMDLNKVINVLNSILTPFSNPFLYTLRNKNVQNVIKRTLRIQ
ncbi:olfactory receptor 287-like [Bufo gargarizans]|uniref:olfactory receptor 287-like n=1 Tax=Bufo gargarizans TaxID=30331 RepID=UPI001CF2E3B7|nr:olfactory receptor 287-like [Bufo gargarizans]